MAATALAAGVLAALGVGCEGESKLNVLVEEGPSALHVNLPSVPTLPAPPPVNHPDGSFTVYGIRHSAARDAKNWNKQQRVKGWIVHLYVPRTPQGRPCTERDHCSEERPHVYIADSRTERDPTRQLMVTGYAMFQSDIDQARDAALHHRPPSASQAQLQAQGLTHPVPTDFDEGAEVVVTGNFTRRAANGQADSAGLIEYASHTTSSPAPAPTARNAH